MGYISKLKNILGKGSVDYVGYLDEVDGLVVKGWAFNRKNPEERVEVVVLVDGKAVAESIADKYREDLEHAGIGDGRHSFSISLPENIRNGKEHEIAVLIKKSNKHLNNSPVKKFFSEICACTIISKNYFSQAKVLAESYKKNHPDHDFVIILVDKRDEQIPNRLECGAEVIEVLNVPIPALDRFIYWYTIMELNTAVKPYVLDFLFKTRKYDKVIYLDPDIYIFKPLEEVFKALEENNSIVLTPHITNPYYDDLKPSETNILQSGVYNLGFIGLKNSETAYKLLEWWKQKLFIDCIVDIENGLFVDQKWIDLVPTYFPDFKILYHLGYNTAYWNLHERKIRKRNGEWLVNDKWPLVFFHFSGYSPLEPYKLSKHQNRFNVNDYPELEELFNFYREQLLKADYLVNASLEYSFETLPNGVKIPLDLIRNLLQWAVRNSVPIPSPLHEPDKFCRFIMSKGVIPLKRNVVALYYFLLLFRRDVLQAFPKAIENTDDEGFRNWLVSSGIKEIKNLEHMFKFENKDQVVDYVEEAFESIRKKGRLDVFEYYSEMWKDKKIFEAFSEWLSIYAPKEGFHFNEKYTIKLKEAYGKLFSLINFYILRGDLQQAFPRIWDDEDRKKLIRWLEENRYNLELSLEDISLFNEFLKSNRDFIQKIMFLYGHYGNPSPIVPNVWDAEYIKRFKMIDLDIKEIMNFLYENLNPVDNYTAKFGEDNLEILQDNNYETIKIPHLSLKDNVIFMENLRNGLKKKEEESIIRVNLAGFFNAPTSLGESANSMFLKLSGLNTKIRKFTLPHPKAMGDINVDNPVIFGWPDSLADVSIVVANADTRHLFDTFIPKIFWSERNVGYWVWETEELPYKFKKSEEYFDEIWTPSNYSAEAIRKTINRPIHVIPHVLDLEAIDKSVADRKAFGLPENALLFGFMFDPQSVIERKNVKGLIEAFKGAFRKDDNVYLVLKVNGSFKTIYDYEVIKTLSSEENIIIIEATWDKQTVYNFMKSLDVYVSLHRSEGFGLTCAEAMAMGKPVIATGYSGNLEFMTDENSILVPAKVIETERPYGPYPAGSRWGDPDLEFAADAMRKMLDKEFREHLGKKAMEDIRKKLSPEAVANKVKEVLEGVKR